MNHLLAHLAGWQARLIEAALTWIVGAAAVGLVMTVAGWTWAWWLVPILGLAGAALEGAKHLVGATTMATLEER